MPLKEMTEADFIRLLAPAPFDISLTLVAPATHRSRNTTQEHIDRFYISPAEMLGRGDDPDGVIVTGAPVEALDFEAVDSREELTAMMDTLRRRRIPTVYICWGALAALYHHYGIAKEMYTRKVSGVFPQFPTAEGHPLFRGMTPPFMVPNSRYSGVAEADIDATAGIDVAAKSPDSGVYMVSSTEAPSIISSATLNMLPTLSTLNTTATSTKGSTHPFRPTTTLTMTPRQKPVDRWHSHAVGLFTNRLATLKG